MKLYLKGFYLPNRKYEADFMKDQKRTCFTSYYPFNVFETRNFSEFDFDAITILYGSNGSGKSTFLNVIADYLKIKHNSVYNTTTFMEDYVNGCEADISEIPKQSKIITSDDVFNYLADVRYMNMGIDSKRVDLFEEFYDRRKPMKLKSIADYDNYKNHVDAMRKTSSGFIREHLLNNVRTESNGESAIKYFTSQITENALYLLDEPENSLSPAMQLKLKEYIENSVVGYNCQFVIATHSPFLLSLKNAKIYDLDDVYGISRKWTELENTRIYYDFFQEHKEEFK